MGKQKELINKYLTISEISKLSTSGLTERQIYIAIKKYIDNNKQIDIDYILKTAPRKILRRNQEKEAKDWLLKRFGVLKDNNEKKIPFRVPKRKLVKKTDAQLKKYIIPLDQYIEIIIPIDIIPSVNEMYISRNIMRSYAIVSLIKMQDIIDKAVEEYNWTPTYKSYLYIDMYFNFNKLNRDTHNTFKLLFDTMEGIVYNNDRYILPRVMDITTKNEKEFLKICIYLKENKI